MRKFLNIEFVFTFFIFLFISYVLLSHPIIGKHNNGDFGRTMGIVGLSEGTQNYEEIYDDYVHSKYFINPLQVLILWGSDWTSCVLTIKLSAILNMIFYSFKDYNIGFLSMTYIFFFSISIYLILKYSKQITQSKFIQCVIGILLLSIFTDIGYISYFNSFFGEAQSFVFLFFTIGTALLLFSKETPKIWQLVLFMISTIVFITAKGQNIPLLVFFIIFYIRMIYIFREKRIWKTIVILTCVSIFVSTMAYMSIGRITTICNKYQSVFTGILKDSPTPGKDLKSLGIDSSYSNLAGTNFFTKDLSIDQLDPSLEKSLYSKINSAKVLMFYLTHPQRLYSKVQESASVSFAYFPINKGNFEKGKYSESKWLYNSFRTWLSIEYRTIFQNVTFIFIFTFLYFAVLIGYHIKSHNLRFKVLIELFVIIGLSGLCQYIVPIIGSGSGDLVKHLFLLNLCYDIMFSLSTAWLISMIKSKGGSLFQNFILNHVRKRFNSTIFKR